MKKLKSKWIRYSLVGILLLISAALYIRQEYNRKAPDTSTMVAAFTPSADELFSAFSKNESEANLKYLDKPILVEGNIKEWESNEEGALTIVLGVNAGMSSVRCCMDSAHAAALQEIPVGTVVAVKGICTGYTADELVGSDVILKRCVINK